MAPALARDCSKAPVQHCALRPTPTAQSVLAWHLPQWAVRVLRQRGGEHDDLDGQLSEPLKKLAEVRPDPDLPGHCEGT